MNERNMFFMTRYVRFLMLLVIIMFLITICLSFIILTKDCKCSNPTYRPDKSEYTQNLANGIDHKLAVLVPYRERFEELQEFVPFIFNFLKGQNINHNIFLLNQIDKYRFNRASLINVGFLYTNTTHDYIAMHDVDLLPLNNQLSYGYPKNGPFHIAAPHLHPKYNYTNFVGGILLISREHYQLVNGMSNKYWGWGLEDDEFFVRLREVKLKVERPINITTDRTNTFQHIHTKSRKRDTLKCYNQREVTRKRDRETGLNNVNYKITSERKITIDGAPANVVNIELVCDRRLTPWCDCFTKHNDIK